MIDNLIDTHLIIFQFYLFDTYFLASFAPPPSFLLPPSSFPLLPPPSSSFLLLHNKTVKDFN